MTVHFQLKFIRKKKAVMKRWDREKLKTKSKELSDKIEEHLEERELMSTEERWNRLKKVVKEAAVETVGYQMGSAPRKPWVTTGMLQELEELQAKGRHDTVYAKTKTLTRKPGGNRDIAIKDRSGKLLQDPVEVRTRWKEYIEELYKGVDNSHDYKEEEPQSEDDMGPDFLKDEILAAIGEIKNNKAEGIDNIPIEMLKTFGEKAMKELVQLCKEIYNTGVWPEEFLQTVMVTLKKKTNAMTCEDHRTISLLTHASKIVLRVLTKRLQSRAERDNCIGEDQYGFRKGKGTRDAIGALRVMTERSLQHGQNIDVCFCRLRKGFR